MNRRREAMIRRLAAAATFVLAAGVGRRLAAQVVISIPTITENGHATDSISPAPVISINATPVPVNVQPSTITLEVSRDPVFSNPIAAPSANGSSASFVLNQLLPERTVIYFRARILDVTGAIRAEQISHYSVASWLRLDNPVRVTNDVLFTRQPTFAWSSPGITLPPGPWQYSVDIINTATNDVVQEPNSANLNDTTYVPALPLDACTSFKWRVTARALNGGPNDQVTVNSPGTFVIQTAECPTATIFYQNFPNPFGRDALQPNTCFWFDLAHPSTVTLTIYDLRLHEVRHILPGPLSASGAQLAAGPYGRQNDVTQTGCDARLQWDGRDDNGRMVPPGVYIAAFNGDGVRTTHKLLFKGAP